MKKMKKGGFMNAEECAPMNFSIGNEISKENNLNLAPSSEQAMLGNRRATEHIFVPMKSYPATPETHLQAKQPKLKNVVENSNLIRNQNFDVLKTNFNPTETQKFEETFREKLHAATNKLNKSFYDPESHTAFRPIIRVDGKNANSELNKVDKPSIKTPQQTKYQINAKIDTSNVLNPKNILEIQNLSRQTRPAEEQPMNFIDELKMLSEMRGKLGA